MNFDGFTAYPIERFSSLVEMDDPTNLPIGVLGAARNVKFRLTRVSTRDGVQNQYGFQLADDGVVTGLAALKVGGPTGDLQVPIAFSALGNLYKEYPVGSGKVVPISDPNGLVTLPANASMQVAAQFKNGYLAFGDLKNSLASPAVYNPSLNTLDPLSMLPFGFPWQAGRKYFRGECVTPATPVGGNGQVYQVSVAGTSGVAQPNFTAQGGNAQATKLTTSGTQSGGGTAWNNPNNVTSQDLINFAVAALGANSSSETLLASVFGFAIPGGANVVGVKVTGVAYQQGPAATGYFTITLAGVGGATAQKAVAPNLANNPSGAVPFSLGGQTDLWGAASPQTAATINSAGFGINIVATNGVSAGLGLLVNNIQITVYYTLPASAIIDGTVTWVVATPSITQSAQAGNVPFGVRYMVVLFVNRNGYISGMTQASVVSTTLVDSVHQIAATFPTGPPNTVARILAFTPAGQLGALAGTGVSSAGPYFWIPPNFPNGRFDLTTIAAGVTVADVVSGVTMNATLINDNVTTTGTFNFTDDYLKATLNDVSAYFRKIQVPGSSDIYFSEVLGRMLYAADNLPSGWYVSLQNDPESVYGDTGLVQASENNGQNRTAVRDYDGVCYLMKEKSGFALVPTADDPSTWNANPQWKGSGPCGPRAVDVGTSFMCYVHRSGVYIFEGGKPYRISKEIPITWKRINWKYQQTIWVLIDDETREIRIGVPYGKSTVPNLVLKCNYEELISDSSTPPTFAPPVHFSPYIGKEIASGNCYKWSIDDIAANIAIRAERILATPANNLPQDFDLPTTQAQILFGSANADGWVSPIIPDTLDDNGNGIDSYIETACPALIDGDGKVIKSMLAPHRLGGVQLNIGGKGQGGVIVLGWRGKDQKQGGPPMPAKAKVDRGSELRLKKPWIADVPYSCGGSMTNERMRIRITNDKRPGVGFEVKWAGVYAQPISTARPS